MIDFFCAYDNIHSEGSSQSSQSIVSSEDNGESSNGSSVILERLDSLEEKLSNILSARQVDEPDGSTGDEQKGVKYDSKSDLQFD